MSESGPAPRCRPNRFDTGQRQLDTIRQNAGHDYLVAKDNSSDTTTDNHPTLDPVLFDADGEAIIDIKEVGQLIAGGTLEQTRAEWDTDDASDEPTRTWIVPAIVLEHVSQSERSQTSREGRTRRMLACLNCGEATRHTFAGWNEVAHPEFADTPIWECTWCESSQHGPDPDSEPADRHSQ